MLDRADELLIKMYFATQGIIMENVNIIGPYLVNSTLAFPAATSTVPMYRIT